jgi:DNA-binding CsgD family transcriptional regulator
LRGFSRQFLASDLGGGRRCPRPGRFSGPTCCVSVTGAFNTLAVTRTGGGREREVCCPMTTMAERMRLTRREQALVAAVVDGCGNRAIARRFGLQEQTVKNQLSVLFQKVGVSTRLELAMYAVREGLVGPGPASTGK